MMSSSTAAIHSSSSFSSSARVCGDVIVLDDSGMEDDDVPIALLLEARKKFSDHPSVSGSVSLAQFKTPPPPSSFSNSLTKTEQTGKQTSSHTKKRKRIVVDSDEDEWQQEDSGKHEKQEETEADEIEEVKWTNASKLLVPGGAVSSSSSQPTCSGEKSTANNEGKQNLKEGLSAYNGIYDVEEEDDDDDEDDDEDDDDESDDDEELVLKRPFKKVKGAQVGNDDKNKTGEDDNNVEEDDTDDADSDDEDYLDEEDDAEDAEDAEPVDEASSSSAAYSSFSSFSGSGSYSSSPAPFNKRAADVRRLFSDLMRRHGLHLLNGGWRLCWDRSRTCAGLTDFRRKTISLSAHFITRCDLHLVTNTILHEIAHALVGAEHTHDAVWRRKALAIGCDGERCHNFRFVHAPFIFRCKGGCWADERYKRSGKDYACSICGSAVEYIPNTPKNAHFLTDAQKRMNDRQQQEKQQKRRRRRVGRKGSRKTKARR